jgi:hypothetical protein
MVLCRFFAARYVIKGVAQNRDRLTTLGDLRSHEDAAGKAGAPRPDQISR